MNNFIEQAWQVYSRQVLATSGITAQSHPIQYAEIKKTFYAGAFTITKIASGILEEASPEVDKYALLLSMLVAVENEGCEFGRNQLDEHGRRN